MTTTNARPQRQSSRAAAQKIAAQSRSSPPAPRKRTTKTRPRDASDSEVAIEDEDAPSTDGDDLEEEVVEPAPKRRRVAPKKTDKAATAALHALLFQSTDSASAEPAELPSRKHASIYHRPFLLSTPSARQSLFDWFDATFSSRGMPWRKPFLPPSTTSPDELATRAYEVWISEIMLQQTRVAVVIDYWNRWMAKWPTLAALASASVDDVLAMWRGLGYYSRARRIHEAAVKAVKEMDGKLPSTAAEMEAKIPGVGRYTAGAVTAIVYGRAEPMVDGNVLRVLSRQLGILGDVKGDKQVIDLFWAAADSLVKTVARDGDEEASNGEPIPLSDKPGRWGQALMELGSTVCTPNPNCGACPISSTCRVYAEGSALARSKEDGDARTATAKPMVDIEDSCNLCETYEFAADEGEAKPKGAKRPAKGKSSFFTPPPERAEARSLDIITKHARKFPLKVIKKAVREEELLVCAVRLVDGTYLIQKRPEKGLLAGLWELPSYTMPEMDQSANIRKRKAVAYVADLLGLKAESHLHHIGEIGTVPWLFSHLKSTMHVHLFEIDGAGAKSAREATKSSRFKWVSEESLNDESMGTGMHKCWSLVKETGEIYVG